MSSFASTTKTAWATVSATGAVGTVRNPQTGMPATDAKWSRVRTQVARTFIADPDCFYYQAYLASNRQYGAALALKSTITQMIQYAEGALYPSRAAPTLQTPPTYLSGATSLEGIKETATILAQRAQAAAASSKVGQRLMERGDEARARYLEMVPDFIQKYFAVQTALSLLSDADPDFEPLRRLALVDVQTSADAASSAVYSAKTAAAFAVQNAAASAALRTVNRIPSIHTRFSYKQVFFPADVVATVAGTTITFTQQSPAYCYLRIGDVFSWAGGETTITAVDTTTATLAADVGTPSSYSVTPGARASLLVLQDACAAFLNGQSVADKSFRLQISDLSSAQRIREAISTLAGVQNALTGMSTEVSATLERLGLPDPVVVSPVSSALYIYAPVVASSTKASAKACLSSLESEGFQLAAQRYLSANLTFLSESAEAQQMAGLLTATLEGRV